MLVDEPHERGDGRSSSAAKKADAVFKIAFARRSSRFSRSSSASRADRSVLPRAAAPASIWACLTQPRNVSRLMPSCSPTRLQAAGHRQLQLGIVNRSSTSRTARSRSSSGYFLGAAMTPSFRGINASTRP